MANATGYFATIDSPIDRQRVGTFVKREILRDTKHDTREAAYAQARAVAATRPGTTGGIIAADQVRR